MMENMIGELAHAMQDDRRAQAANRARLVEAEAAHSPHAQGAWLRTRRAAIAKARAALTRRRAPVPAPRLDIATGETQ